MAALRDGKLLHRAERASNVLFVSAMLAAIVVTVAQDAFQGDDLMWLHHALLIWLAMAIALAALIHAYLVWMVFAEQVRQYERMSIVFGRAAHALDSIDVGDTEVQTSLLRQLGLDALRENGWWLTLHRARPVEMFRG